jgi:putative membrane protein
MRISLFVIGLAGMGLALHLFSAYGLSDVAAAAAAVGWGLVLVCLVRALPLLCDAIGWRVLFPQAWRPGLGSVLWIRWVSESVNALLPVAQIGGEVVRARLVSRPGLTGIAGIGGARAGATVVADLTTGMVGTMVFSITGVILLLQRTISHEVASGLYWAMGGMAAMLVGFVVAQRSGLLTGVMRKLMKGLGGSLAAAVAGGTAAFEAALAEVYRDKSALAASSFWRLASWVAGTAEIWLTLHFQGISISIADALLIESISVTVRSAAFAVPGGLGVQEGSLLVLGQMIGLSPQTALGLALIKRVRELATGLPALAVWWAAEGRAAVRQEA